MNPLQRLLTKWASEEVTPRPPVDPSAVASFEERYGVRLPEDFREYLSVCDGMNPGEMDSDLFSFWALSRIRPVPDELPEPEYRAYREFPGAASFFCFHTPDSGTIWPGLNSCATKRSYAVTFRTGAGSGPFRAFI